MASQKTLIPPLTLYRQILRAHRKHLPPQFRILGDGYVKAEFHRHKDVDNPLYIVGFLEQWQDYLNHILIASPKQNQSQSQSQSQNQDLKQQAAESLSSMSSIPTTVSTTSIDTIKKEQEKINRETTLQRMVEQGRAFGRKLDPGLLDKMTDQQLGQLYELRKETKGLQTREELEEIAKEEAQLLEKFAANIPASSVSSPSLN
ncbi:acetate non-utilizing protein 9 [Lobosporangium transversale]|uniref:Succinate dehydrogenase assembly factor 3 n=1 Tax=Lobosporangium transversale TaxID=64571 RepID=A0A1Y2H3Y8_9FUNG|nr:hypothetical protein BCR41DRAFT_417877 [Lobosporangium transversale]KAF9912025.1 acetate non-utilizing protein 9 [Lobosporangium transversale]ORZ28744.1 hypothetical protein BCR41DRAFT_417877 [Lobosporangium transversale]|eukprot:XP_021886417.1 hypothetical protein BCR41DRAFT_417877 [Lobosporangium transversale]